MVQCAQNGGYGPADHPAVPSSPQQITADRVAAVQAWHTPPDLVSLNVDEDGMLELGQALLARGIGIEAVVDAGLAAGHDVRVGLEDSLVGRDGGRAPDNAEQVADAVARAAG